LPSSTFEANALIAKVAAPRATAFLAPSGENSVLKFLAAEQQNQLRCGSIGM